MSTPEEHMANMLYSFGANHPEAAKAVIAHLLKDVPTLNNNPSEMEARTVDSRGNGAWYDQEQYRECLDGSLHQGNLQLITWDKGSRGWGASAKNQSETLKKKFEGEYESNEESFFKYRPQGFRWTCCGTDSEHGCDHHTLGCICNFCKSGRIIPEEMLKSRDESQYAHGLVLGRGLIH